MCGFAGIVDFNGRVLPPDSLQQAGLALAHRGPDSTGEAFFDLPHGATAGLVHRRLSILDLSDLGRQPMGAWTKPDLPPCLCKPWQASEADLVLAYNGEIYNFRDLNEDLTRTIGFQRRSDCDSETLLAGYAVHGKDFFHQMHGMWAFAVLDRRPSVSPSVLLCRDRYGKKPLLWAWHDRRLLFASEMRGLLPLMKAAGLPRTLNLSAVEHLLQLGFTLDPATILADVHSLPPGHLLTATCDGPMVQRWHDPKSEIPPPAFSSPGQNLELTIKNTIDSAVCDRLVSDVPLGAFLSGGVDSSIVTYHLTRHVANVATFNIAFPDQPRFDESAYAAAAAKAFGTRHTTFPVQAKDLQELIPAVLDHLAEPFADSSLLATWILSRLTRRHVTVALSGDGGDELFVGYQRYRAYFAAERRSARLGAAFLSFFPAGKQSTLGNLARQARKFRRGLKETDPVRRHLAWIGSDWPEGLLTPTARAALQSTDSHASALALYQSAAASCTLQPAFRTPLDLALHLDFTLGLPCDMLKKVDLASMAHGLEVRCPFLDPRVVELAQGLASHELAPGGRLKGLLVDAYQDVLPRQVWNRPKQGFEVPVGAWLSGPLREFFWDTVSPTNVAKLGLFDCSVIERLLAEQAQLRREHGQLLWTLLVLHGWAARWL